jgi:hypothetical protein
MPHTLMQTNNAFLGYPLNGGRRYTLPPNTIPLAPMPGGAAIGQFR